MDHVRAALYLDFDNVFSGLYKLDPDVAVHFAEDPGGWLRRLATTATTDGVRRWLVLRCYLNPAGWVYRADPDGEQTRLYFSKFRPSFVRAGFDVIDCPRYSSTKNAADIRIVVDAVDALSADTRYEEFVIASGDSDMTPLLQRLRRSDRRTMIVSPADAAEAFTAIADQVLDSQHLLALVQGESVDLDDEADSEVEEGFDEHVNPADGDTPDAGQSEAYEAFRSIVTYEYTAATEPMNMASLASRLRTQLGPSVSDSNWFGFGSFARAVASLTLPNLRMSQHLLWDTRRHRAPTTATATPQRVALPDPVERLGHQLDLPRMPQPWWPAIYRTLAEYARSQRFNWTQCTSWARDQLREQGLPISRNAVGFVVRGTSFGGCPLHRQPPPTADEIAAAFVGNVLNRADAAEITFSDEEIATVRTWLGAPPENSTEQVGQAENSS
ncbi:NYN domain-containing protein [Micromonospora sp. WMMD1155]|uniref:NYN domain-containing protein n=1 Tax=Micromonospora sp. WMMD1155 TaxID=3016094 RepID=UPI00249CC781|nr:NYN domain-containing protein [Micromonospora sp. WMMD1155]WFE51206.1 NYN domain-containing protein [Micromonospora sp. WMMD1155]